ncbi:MAG: matrixin family metalloprotease [Candidatus Obscuribacterales bacterium]|nr:matrixin family metalloprotease [Candidatus Obscuribacterales bacterium]
MDTFAINSKLSIKYTSSLIRENIFATEPSYAFNFVDDPGRANIDLTWTTDQSKLPVHDEVFKSGTCQFSFSRFGIDGAKIMVLTNDPEKSGAVSDNLIHRICLHEIGHALGLSHSPSQGDVMFARKILLAAYC